MSGHVPEPSNFEPKEPVTLAPPKSDPITASKLSQCNGQPAGSPCYVAIKGKVYDVTGNKSYEPGGPYHVFAGKDASRALAMSSVKPEDVTAKYEDLSDKEKQVLDDWVIFFGKRYNVVGEVKG